MSTSVPPASWKATSWAAASSASVSTPQVIVPSARWLTFRPLRPTLRCSTLRSYRLVVGSDCAGGALWWRGAARTQPRLLGGDGATTRRSWSQEADRLGYSVVWAAEAYGSDAVTVLTWVAAQTERIDVGSAILQIPARTPAMTAMTAATLDALSGGRFRLGLGLSGPQVSEGWHGVRFAKPLARTREYVDIVKLALSRERVRYDGPTYPLPLPDGPGKALHLMLHPVREHIPIYLASVGPKNLELTGEIADGWLAIFFAPQFARASCSSTSRPAGRRSARRSTASTSCPPCRWSSATTSRRARSRCGPTPRSTSAGWAAASRTSTTRWPCGWATPTRPPRCRTGTSPGTTTAPPPPCRRSSSTRPRCSARPSASPSGWPSSPPPA